MKILNEFLRLSKCNFPRIAFIVVFVVSKLSL